MMTPHRRSACDHRLARRPSRRSQDQDHRRVLQDARRAAAAFGRLSGCAYSGRGVSSTSIRSRTRMTRGRICIRTPPSSRARCRRSAFPQATRLSPTIPAAGSPAHRAWWMFLSFGHPNVKVLDGGLQKWTREGPPHPFRGGHGEVWKIPPPRSIPVLCAASSSCWAIWKRMPSNWSMRGTRPRFEGTVVEPWPGRRSGHIPGSRNVPYAELFDANNRRDEAAGGSCARRSRAPGVDMTKPISDDLRLRGLGAWY